LLILHSTLHSALNADQTKFLIQPREGSKLGKADWTRMKHLTSVFEKAMLAGQFWSLTPQKNLYLMHAVPKPLVPSARKPNEKPAFKFSDNLTVSPRATGSKAALLHDPTLRVHRVSTGRIDVYAGWNEYSDAPGVADCPHKEKRSQLCFSSDIDLPDLTIAPDESHMTVDFGRSHEFPTTKHYAVEYHMVATTRYREYYDPKFTANPENITIKSTESKVFHILNTVPPPSPDIVYVLPILIWEDPAKHGATIQRKLRRGLRVYMRRNWYASGEDERLAIVLAPSALSKTVALDADPNSPVPVTQWGANPIWYTSKIKQQPTLDDVLTDPNMLAPPKGKHQRVAIATRGVSAALAAQRDKIAKETKDSGQSITPLILEMRKRDFQVQLQSEDVQEVDIAAFDVHCDHEKDLLYADLEFKETASYSPMVTMALARYQPFSAPYAYLSAVTRWAFQTISPERTISYGVVSEINEDQLRPTRQVRITISGPSPGNPHEGYRRNSFEVLLSDGDNQISEHQIPLSVSNDPPSFLIPVKLFAELKDPTVHIKELEYIGSGDARIVFACSVVLDRNLWT
jgi:hypothetical protein